MKYFLSHIAQITGATGIASDLPIEFLLLDSRKVYSPHSSLFFALVGARRDGHQFIPELYRKGVRAFVVSETPDTEAFPDAVFLRVEDTLIALQWLAAFHRRQFTIPVIGITGSNGKTIVKEWLHQLLHEQYAICRSPKSYNSQIGVPLSVWQLNETHSLGIFEAGISRAGEMDRLQQIINPEIGILTNIGEAHSEGFENREEKLREKLKLFQQSKVVIGRAADLKGKQQLFSSSHVPTFFTWGFAPESECDVLVKNIVKENAQTQLTIIHGDAEQVLTIPFTDDASIENAITCYLTAVHLSVAAAVIVEKLGSLQPVNMRLELKKGINQCTIINDSYSADINSLEIALNFLDQQAQGSRKTIILSDIRESGQQDEELYAQILGSLQEHQVGRLIGIGESISKAFLQLPASAHSGLRIELHSSTQTFLQQFMSSQFREEIILIKGARIFGFESIVQVLEQKVHQTILEINLNSIVHNVNVYQARLKPTVKLMAMVKAFAYGSGGAEIAGILQYHKVDYLGVAYADEGIELRKAGVDLPVMVMNPEETAFESIVEYNLEPDMYSFQLLKSFSKFLEKEGLQGYPIHVEIETGMNRLGFSTDEVEKLADWLKQSTLVKVQSVFTHLAASEDPAEDDFTRLQFSKYKAAAAMIRSRLQYEFIEHIANTAAIFRFPEMHLGMVRLGIGMYGIDSAIDHQDLLSPAASLKTTVAQVKHLKKGESVSYNRKGVVQRDSKIATVRLGYADGYSRRLGNGVGKMWVNGSLAPVIGSICMDMTMIDVTDIPVIEEGDEVVVFGRELPVQMVAGWAGTIPYEIMTGISQRVKRVYFEE